MKKTIIVAAVVLVGVAAGLVVFLRHNSKHVPRIVVGEGEAAWPEGGDIVRGLQFTVKLDNRSNINDVRLIGRLTNKGQKDIVLEVLGIDGDDKIWQSGHHSGSPPRWDPYREFARYIQCHAKSPDGVEIRASLLPPMHVPLYQWSEKPDANNMILSPGKSYTFDLGLMWEPDWAKGQFIGFDITRPGEYEVAFTYEWSRNIEHCMFIDWYSPEVDATGKFVNDTLTWKGTVPSNTITIEVR